MQRLRNSIYWALDDVITIAYARETAKKPGVNQPGEGAILSGDVSPGVSQEHGLIAKTV
jgi:hypothetical protein